MNFISVSALHQSICTWFCKAATCIPLEWEKLSLHEYLLCFSLQCQGRPSGIPGPGGKRGSLQRGWISLGQGGLCEGSLKWSERPQIHGPRWNAPISTEGAGRCHCWATLHHLWEVLEDRGGAWGLEKGQCHSNLQKGQEGGPRELQACQPHLHPGKGDGAASPGGHHQASGRKEGYQE